MWSNPQKGHQRLTIINTSLSATKSSRRDAIAPNSKKRCPTPHTPTDPRHHFPNSRKLLLKPMLYTVESMFRSITPGTLKWERWRKLLQRRRSNNSTRMFLDWWTPPERYCRLCENNGPVWFSIAEALLDGGNRWWRTIRCHDFHRRRNLRVPEIRIRSVRHRHSLCRAWILCYRPLIRIES